MAVVTNTGSAATTTLLVSTHNPAVPQRAQRRITIRDGYLTEPPGPQAAAPDGARHVQG